MSVANHAISVVVSTRDRAWRLGRLLRSLRDQELARDRFEVIVVDDGSGDGTAPLLEREREAGELTLRVIRRSGRYGPAAGRNVGWRAAAAPLIAFTDDDCEAGSDWLGALLAAAEQHPGRILQGRTEPIPRERDSIGPFSRTVEVTSLGPFFQTCNIAYPRELLERLDGFDEQTFRRQPGGEDTDLALRGMEMGTEAVFVDRARVYHAVNQLGPVGMLRVALRWSDTMALFARHPAMRQELHRGIFWKSAHLLLLRAALGVLLAPRFPPALFLTYRYGRRLRRRARSRGASLWLIPYFVLHDALEIYAAVRGGLRHRVLVL